MSKEKKAIVINNRAEITVYRHRERNTWVSTEDYETEYKPEELTFL